MLKFAGIAGRRYSRYYRHCTRPIRTTSLSFFIKKCWELLNQSALVITRIVNPRVHPRWRVAKGNR